MKIRGIFDRPSGFGKKREHVLILFILGGTNYGEIQAVRELVSKRHSNWNANPVNGGQPVRVYFGSTSVLTPNVATSLVFQS